MNHHHETMNLKETDLNKFFKDQISFWPLACSNHRKARQAKTKEAEINGLRVKVHYLPDRVISTKAKTDPESIANRLCCFCAENRPKEQRALPFDGRKGKKYDILVNPYPIYAPHFVVAQHQHHPQTITGKYVDLLDLAAAFPTVTFFYNGPSAGATIPEHHHFQACPRGTMPLEKALVEAFEARANEKPNALTRIIKMLDARLYHFDLYLPGIFVIRSKTIKSAAKLFYRLLDCAPMPKDPFESEPRFNLSSFLYNGEFVSIIVFRSTHRSHHYYEKPDSPDYLAMSPGCADMMGDIVMVSQKDFDELPLEKVTSMLEEVAITADKQQKIIERFTRRQPNVEIPLEKGKEICFEVLSDGAGRRMAKADGGKVLYGGSYYDELYFEAQSQDRMFARASFVLFRHTKCEALDPSLRCTPHQDDLNTSSMMTKDAFRHSDAKPEGRSEESPFAGALRITAQGDVLVVSNILGIEDYLLSVLSTNSVSQWEGSLEETKARCIEARRAVLEQNYIFPQYEGVKQAPLNNVVRAIDATWGKTQ